MDAAYLRKHVQGALTEALLAMAVEQPEDSVEFVGRYLIELVQRDIREVPSRCHPLHPSSLIFHCSQKRAAEDLREAEELAEAEARRVDKLERERIDVLIAQEKHAKRLSAFIESMAQAGDKQALMDAATEFLAGYLEVPASYVAIKRGDEESEVLYYTSSNASQRFLVGKKLPKVDFDEEDPVERQGICFDAFIVKAPPDEEEVDVDDENYVPPPPPKPEPLVVANTMREKRLRFLGIPQLGSFLAVPLAFNSVEHETGCVQMEPEEEEEPVAEPAAEQPEDAEEAGEGQGEAAAPAKEPRRVNYAQNKVAVELVLCVDTVGRYRPITDHDIDVLSRVGESLVSCFASIEASVFSRHVGFLQEAAGADLAAALSRLQEEESRGDLPLGC